VSCFSGNNNNNNNNNNNVLICHVRLCICKNSRSILTINKKIYIAFEKNFHCLQLWLKSYWTLHEELQAYLCKTGGQIPQYLCPFYCVPEDSGFIYTQPASIATYRDCCRQQERDKNTVFLSEGNIFRKQLCRNTKQSIYICTSRTIF
jgi:hypothetical protein